MTTTDINITTHLCAGDGVLSPIDPISLSKIAPENMVRLSDGHCYDRITAADWLVGRAGFQYLFEKPKSLFTGKELTEGDILLLNLNPRDFILSYGGDFRKIREFIKQGRTKDAIALLDAGAWPDARDTEGTTHLIAAASAGDYFLVDKLVEKGADPRACNNEKWAALHAAAANNHFRIIQKLVGHGLEVDVRCDVHWTALMIAAREGHYDAVKTLLHLGAGPDADDEYGNTSLIIAASRGRASVVDMLIGGGASVDATDSSGRSCLSWASFVGNAVIVTAILMQKKKSIAQLPREQQASSLVDFVNRTDAKGKVSLMFAAERGNDKVIEILLAHGAFIDKAESTGITSLMLAASLGHASTVRLLLDKGSNAAALTSDYGFSTLMIALLPIAFQVPASARLDVVRELLKSPAIQIRARDQRGMTALMYAAREGFFEIVKELVAAGADINEADASGMTGLMHAIKQNQPWSVGLALVLIDPASRVNVNAATKLGMTALMFASQRNQIDVMNALSKQGADKNAVTIFGHNSLMIAEAANHVDAVKLLLDLGVPIDAKAKDGFTALMYAVHYGHPSMTKLLLDRGATVIYRTGIGWSTLMLAVRQGNAAIVKMLLAYRGVGVNEIGSRKETSLMIAVDHCHVEVVRILLEAGAEVDKKDDKGKDSRDRIQNCKDVKAKSEIESMLDKEWAKLQRL